MNIDVKNAIDKLLIACSSVQTIASGEFKDITRIVLQDIYSFIAYISLNGKEERIIRFKESYMDTELREIEPYVIGKLPISFEYICRIDKILLANRNTKISALFTTAVVEIGKYYTLSKYDKKEIDTKRFTEYLYTMNEYISKALAEKLVEA